MRHTEHAVLFMVFVIPKSKDGLCHCMQLTTYTNEQLNRSSAPSAWCFLPLLCIRCEFIFRSLSVLKWHRLRFMLFVFLPFHSAHRTHITCANTFNESGRSRFIVFVKLTPRLAIRHRWSEREHTAKHFVFSLSVALQLIHVELGVKNLRSINGHLHSEYTVLQMEIVE